MSNSPATIIDVAPARTQPQGLADLRRQRWLEVCLILIIAFGRSLLSSFYLLKNGPGALPHISNLGWSIGLAHEVTGLILLGYVLSRRKLRFKDLGLRWSLRDVGAGAFVVGVSYAAYLIGSALVHVIHYAMYGTIANGPSGRDFFAHPGVMAIPYCLLNPFFEELIVRAYLMTEVLDLTSSSALAVALSVAVQFSYHLYYGWAGAISLSFQFLIFALYYVRSRRALPIIVAHGFFDVYAFVRLWAV